MDVNWGAILTAVLIAVVPTLTVAVFKMAMVWVQAKQAEVKRWQPAVGDFISQAAEFAVVAAEQSGLSNLIKDKKTFALDAAERWLEARGITGVDLHLLDAEIERQVMEMFPRVEPTVSNDPARS